MWKYTLRDLTADDDPEQLARSLADEGWILWPKGTGVPVTINGRQFRRYSLRRWAGAGPPPDPVP